MSKNKSYEPFTQREIKTLYRLLARFYRAKKLNMDSVDQSIDDSDFLSVGERSIVSSVQQWVKWFSHDEMLMDEDKL